MIEEILLCCLKTKNDLSKTSSYQREIDWSSEVDVFCLAKYQGQGSEGHELGTKAIQEPLKRNPMRKRN